MQGSYGMWTEATHARAHPCRAHSLPSLVPISLHSLTLSLCLPQRLSTSQHPISLLLAAAL